MGKESPSARKQKRAFWQDHINNWQSSGQTQRAYCLSNGIALATFCYWRHKLKQNGCKKPRFYPLTVVNGQTIQQEDEAIIQTGLRITFKHNRFAIDIPGTKFSEQTLRKLIICLEEIQ